jgi:hypothetical protein
MSKGSSPRSCFSEQFQSNYESINWNRGDVEPEVGSDEHIINGCGDDHVEEDVASANESCANE